MTHVNQSSISVKTGQQRQELNIAVQPESPWYKMKRMVWKNFAVYLSLKIKFLRRCIYKDI